ncbi:MAG: class I SAM-dependent methyltransferase [Actinomycetes bacterium]
MQAPGMQTPGDSAHNSKHPACCCGVDGRRASARSRCGDYVIRAMADPLRPPHAGTRTTAGPRSSVPRHGTGASLVAAWGSAPGRTPRGRRRAREGGPQRAVCAEPEVEDLSTAIGADRRRRLHRRSRRRPVARDARCNSTRAGNSWDARLQSCSGIDDEKGNGLQKPFKDHYVGCYSGGGAELRTWRELGARDKASNVARLWAHAEGPRRPTVADIGCGEGAVAAELARTSFYATLRGFDVSPDGVALAAERGLQAASFEHFDGERIPLPDRAVDLSVLSHVVEHVEEPRVVIREAARVARWVFVEVPLEHNVRHLGDFEWTDVGHINFYDLPLIRQLIQSCGLVVRAQLVTNPGLAWAHAGRNTRGLAKWRVKQSVLKIAPGLAQAVFTYHGCLLAESP